MSSLDAVPEALVAREAAAAAAAAAAHSAATAAAVARTAAAAASTAAAQSLALAVAASCTGKRRFAYDLLQRVAFFSDATSLTRFSSCSRQCYHGLSPVLETAEWFVYSIGGATPEEADSPVVERYSVEKDKWETQAPIPARWTDHSRHVFSYEGQVYVICWQPSYRRRLPEQAVMLRHDARADAWLELAALPLSIGEPREVVTVPGGVYVAGPHRIARFCFHKSRWALVPLLPEQSAPPDEIEEVDISKDRPRAYFRMVAMRGELYTLGGWGQAGRPTSARFERLLVAPDIGMSRWESLPDLPFPHVDKVVAVGSSIIVINPATTGRGFGDYSPGNVGKSWRFQYSNANVWEEASFQTTSWLVEDPVVLKGSVYLVSSMSCPSDIPRPRLDKAAVTTVFRLTVGKKKAEWETVPNMQFAQGGFSTIAINELSTIFTVGGIGDGDAEDHFHVERFGLFASERRSVGIGAWNTCSPLPTARLHNKLASTTSLKHWRQE